MWQGAGQGWESQAVCRSLKQILIDRSIISFVIKFSELSVRCVGVWNSYISLVLQMKCYCLRCAYIVNVILQRTSTRKDAGCCTINSHHAENFSRTAEIHCLQTVNLCQCFMAVVMCS